MEIKDAISANYSQRYITKYIQNDLEKKIVLLGGPRQVGKTTLSKSLPLKTHYLNYDVVADRKGIMNADWPSTSELVVLDELHKLRKWKNYLKGIYDSSGIPPRILVTGSARLDIVKKMGDSLAGRFFYWRLHPLCPKELITKFTPQKSLERIINQSGFPEPFFATPEDYPRWAKTHIDIILRQDLVDLEQVSDISSVETLIEMLSLRVGSTVSYESLARDLNRSPVTIKRWITLLENLFIIFRVTPWSKKISRSLLKAPKFYFFDTGRVQGDIGAKYENSIACALIKEIDFVNDLNGSKLTLHYLRDRMGHELDFAICSQNKIKIVIEAKWNDDDFAAGFTAFADPLNEYKAELIQLVGTLTKSRESKNGILMQNGAEWLAQIDFSKMAQYNPLIPLKE